MSDFDEYEIIGTPEGMGMFLVHFELSNEGEAIEEATAISNIEALDLEEVFHLIEEDMAIEFQLRDFVNQNYGQVEFDAWKPIKIFQFTLTEDGDIDEDNEPNVVWEV